MKTHWSHTQLPPVNLLPIPLSAIYSGNTVLPSAPRIPYIHYSTRALPVQASCKYYTPYAFNIEIDMVSAKCS